jgi:hypothetical protein
MSEKPKKQRKSIDLNETKANRFIRVVTPRIAKAIKAISVIGYCSSPVYEYTSEQVKQILTVLTNGIVALESRYASKKAAGTEFKFK